MDYFSQTISNHLILMDNLFLSTYIFYNGKIFENLSGFHLIVHHLMQALPHIESIYYLYFANLLLGFSFMSSLEDQYLNHHVQNLLFEICNSSNELYFTAIFWTRWLKSFINNFICIIIKRKTYIVAPWVH